MEGNKNYEKRNNDSKKRGEYKKSRRLHGHTQLLLLNVSNKQLHFSENALPVSKSSHIQIVLEHVISYLLQTRSIDFVRFENGRIIAETDALHPRHDVINRPVAHRPAALRRPAANGGRAPWSFWSHFVQKLLSPLRLRYGW